MARKPFVVLDAEILSSSVWAESAHVKLVWITLLVLCDTEGYVGAAVPGIARAAGVTLEQAQDALARFQQPDEHSRTKERGGQRLEVAERGFRILNFMDHVDRLSSEKTKNRDRVRRWRERKAQREAVTVMPGNVTVPTGRSEQGEVSREQGEGTNGVAATDCGLPNENGALTSTEFAREVWALYSQRRGSDLPMATNKEFALIRRWFDQGIPLRAVATGLRECKGTGRTLLYYGPAVEEEAARIQRAMQL